MRCADSRSILNVVRARLKAKFMGGDLVNPRRANAAVSQFPIMSAVQFSAKGSKLAAEVVVELVPPLGARYVISFIGSGHEPES